MMTHGGTTAVPQGRFCIQARGTCGWDPGGVGV